MPSPWTSTSCAWDAKAFARAASPAAAGSPEDPEESEAPHAETARHTTAIADARSTTADRRRSGPAHALSRRGRAGDGWSTSRTHRTEAEEGGVAGRLGLQRVASARRRTASRSATSRTTSSRLTARRQKPAMRPSSRTTRLASGRSAADHARPGGAITPFVSRVAHDVLVVALHQAHRRGARRRRPHAARRRPSRRRRPPSSSRRSAVPAAATAGAHLRQREARPGGEVLGGRRPVTREVAAGELRQRLVARQVAAPGARSSSSAHVCCLPLARPAADERLELGVHQEVRQPLAVDVDAGGDQDGRRLRPREAGSAAQRRGQRLGRRAAAWRRRARAAGSGRRTAPGRAAPWP